LPSAADRRIVERRQPQAFDGAAVAAQVDDLAGDHLALAVGIGGDDQLGRLRQKRLTTLNCVAVFGLTSTRQCWE
jgi:hypothetical protein